MRKGFQHTLTHESSMYRDQLQQTLRRQVCQEEHADAESTREMNQLHHLTSEQSEAMESMLTSSRLSSSSLIVRSKTRM